MLVAATEHCDNLHSNFDLQHSASMPLTLCARTSNTGEGLNKSGGAPLSSKEATPP